VNFVAHDYLAVMGRRMLVTDYFNLTGWDQDLIVSQLLIAAKNPGTTAQPPVSMLPGSYLPLGVVYRNPDGTSRGFSGRQRDRAYAGNQPIGEALSNLAAVQDGFDYDVLANGPAASVDHLRVFYPRQGVTRTDVALVYGVNVATVDRTVSSDDYANYVRLIGNKASTDTAAPQLYAERWNTDANNVTVNPVGLWQRGENASDVSIQATLNEQAQGSLDYHGLIVPSYSLGLRGGAYTWGMVNMGDTVPLAVKSGRLNVNTQVRVVGITYAIGDDGDENVALTVGRAPSTLARALTAAARDIDALARR
jgi:hypothetical protein